MREEFKGYYGNLALLVSFFNDDHDSPRKCVVAQTALDSNCLRALIGRLFLRRCSFRPLIGPVPPSGCSASPPLRSSARFRFFK